MKYKSDKLRKLERNRFSILTDNENVCYLCGRLKSDWHEIYGGGYRQISMKNGFCVPLCRACHREITDNPKKALALKIECQQEFEKTHDRAEFMAKIGKNYLLD